MFRFPGIFALIAIMSTAFAVVDLAVVADRITAMYHGAIAIMAIWLWKKYQKQTDKRKG